MENASVPRPVLVKFDNQNTWNMVLDIGQLVESEIFSGVITNPKT